MKKRQLVMPLIIASMVLTACGGTKSSMDVKYKVADYVTLPKNYKNLEVEVTGDYDYTEEKYNSYLESVLSSAPYIKDTEKTTVAADSIVNVDYVGKKDGKAFDGGSQNGATIDVKNNCDPTSGSSFIEGFTAGLVGAKVGHSVDSKVTFPADYQSTELAGKEVTFTFKVNYIAKKPTLDTLTDEYVNTNFKTKTVDDFKKKVEDNVKASLSNQKQSDVRTAVMEKMVKESKVKYPANLVNARLKEFKTRFRKEYKIEKDQSLEEYVKKNLNMTYKEFEKEAKKNLKENMKTELIFEYVAEKQNIKFDEKGYKKFIKSLKTTNNISTTTELYETFAPNAEAGKAYLKKMYVCTKAINYCQKHAKVTVKPAQQTAQ